MKNRYNPRVLRTFRKAAAICAAAIMPLLADAQVPPLATQYLFTAYPGTYTPISGGTQATGVEGDDVNQINIPIGFSFPFCTGTYTQLSACSNGFISLSNANTSTLTNDAGNATSFGPLMMPLWDDLNGNPAGDAYYQTTGTAPNRVFTFEWRSWRWTWSAAGNNIISFQVKLFEKGRIEFHYSEGPDAVGGSPSATIGIARNGTDFQTLTSTSATPTISTTTFEVNVAAPRPASGQVYAWDAPLPNNASISAITEPTAAICLGSHVAKAQVKNMGGNAINNVILNWSVNGVLQTPVAYSTPIPVGGTSAPVTLGNINFTNPAQNMNIWVWTSQPNGVADVQTSNDSLFLTRKAMNPPGAIVYYDHARVCPGDSVMLYAPTASNYTYQWEYNADPIAGATNNFFYAKQDGFYSVRVFNPGCSAQSTFHKISVKPLQVELGPDVIGCEKTPPTVIDAGEPGSRYIWNTGDTTQTITVMEGQNKYWVEVTLGSVCKASDTVTYTLEPLPEINGISSVKTGGGYTYTFAPGGPSAVETYLWDFGDGTTDTSMITSHTFVIPPPYNVRLMVYNSCGSDTAYLKLAMGIAELETNDLTLYPNPAQSTVNIKAGDNTSISHVKVVNMLGAKVIDQATDNTRNVTLNVSHLGNGHYTMLITTAKGQVNKIFQVTR